MRHAIFVWIALLCASGLPARAADSGHFETAFAEGIWAFGRNDNVSAAEQFQEASRLRPDYGFSLYLLGLSHLRLGMPKEAAEEIAASLAAKEPPPVERSRLLADLGAAQLAAGTSRRRSARWRRRFPSGRPTPSPSTPTPGPSSWPAVWRRPRRRSPRRSVSIPSSLRTICR